MAANVKGIPRNTPRPHQHNAISDIMAEFSVADRATALMACGTGKTMTGLFVAGEMMPKAGTVIVQMPSLALVGQILKEWKENAAWPEVSYACVCSDPTVKGQDEIQPSPEEFQQDTGIKVFDNVDAIHEYMTTSSAGVKVIFSTYQSSRLVSEAAHQAGLMFDLGIYDEAHKTAGAGGRMFSASLHDTGQGGIPIRKRLFMTATPRHAATRTAHSEERVIYSMDNPVVYGNVAHKLSFGAAVAQNLIADYKVIVSVLRTNDITNDDLGVTRVKSDSVTSDGTHISARDAAMQLAIKDAVQAHDLRKVVTFHGNTVDAQKFTGRTAGGEKTAFHELLNVGNQLEGFETWHVNGSMATKRRRKFMAEFAAADRGLISNARCLTEGVDIPAIDMVVFVDPKSSHVDIVQAAGRAMRLSPDKYSGYILVPVFIEPHETLEEAVVRGRFGTVMDVLGAIRDQDDLLAGVIQDSSVLRGMGGDGDGTLTNLLKGPDAKIEIRGQGFEFEDLLKVVRTRIAEELTESWDVNFGRLKAFHAEKKHCRVPKDYQTPDGLRLRRWVSNQRQNWSTLGKEKQDKLLDLGFVISVFDAQWDENYEALKVFHAEKKHCRVSQRHKTPDGLRLRRWVSNQRQNWSTLGKAKQDKLTELGFVLNALDAQWAENYEALKAFHAEQKHCRVPNDHQTQDGLKLGNWVGNQRRNWAALDKAKQDKLTELGFVLNALDAQWAENYEALKAFHAEQKHCRAPKDYQTPDGLKLGIWVRTKRVAYKSGTISQERIDQLNAIGFTWSTPKTSDPETSNTKTVDLLPGQTLAGDSNCRSQAAHEAPPSALAG